MSDLPRSPMAPAATAAAPVVPADLVIRPCEQGDLAALEWFGLFSAHREIIATAFARQGAGGNLMLLAVWGDAPIAQVWIDFERHAPAAFLWAVRVFPWFRGRGIGSRMIRAAEGEVRRRGRTRIDLGVERHNPAARRFYERLGYRMAGEWREPDTFRTPGGCAVHRGPDEWRLSKDLTPPPRRSSCSHRTFSSPTSEGLRSL